MSNLIKVVASFSGIISPENAPQNQFEQLNNSLKETNIKLGASIHETGNVIHDISENMKSKHEAVGKKVKEINEKSKEPNKESSEKSKKLNEESKKISEKKQKDLENKKKQEKLIKEVSVNTQNTTSEAQVTTRTNQTVSGPSNFKWTANGLLVEEATSRAQMVINRLVGIPGHSNGQAYHNAGLDDLIDTLTTEEAIYVLHRIEGAGFGQTGDGYAGLDTPASHQTLVNNQINRRFGGSIHNLLKAWGTFSYGGY